MLHRPIESTMADRRQELKDITYRKLREGYEIIIEESPGTEITGSRSAKPT